MRRRKNQKTSTEIPKIEEQSQQDQQSQQNQASTSDESNNFNLFGVGNSIFDKLQFSRPEWDGFNPEVESITTMEPDTTTDAYTEVTTGEPETTTNSEMDNSDSFGELTTTTDDPTTTLSSTTPSAGICSTDHALSQTTQPSCCCAPVKCIDNENLNVDSSKLIIESIQSIKEECSQHKDQLHTLLDEIKLSHQKLDDMDLKMQSVNDQIANVYEVMRVYILPPSSLGYLDKLIVYRKKRVK